MTTAPSAGADVGGGVGIGVRAVDTSVDVLLGGYRGYLSLFAASPLASRLSVPHPVRHTGFDLQLVVADRTQVAADVVALRLQRRDHAMLPHWTPGAHLDVILDSGTQRQYSLCGDPADRWSYRIAVRRIPGGSGSGEIHDAVAVGDTLRTRGPRNAFVMVAEPEYLFVAAGIGITPILPMVRRAQMAGADWRLVYLGRSRETLPFLDELAGLAGGPGRGLSAGSRGNPGDNRGNPGDNPGVNRVLVRTDDEHGAPTAKDVLDLGRHLDGTWPAAIYLCGPPPLIDAARELIAPEAPRSRLFSERFSAPPVRGGEPFTVRLARTGTTIEVGAEESMLTALRRALPGVTYSCQQGFCGTCKVTTLAGKVEHRDTLLLDPEREHTMLPCMSRGTGELVVDL